MQRRSWFCLKMPEEIVHRLGFFKKSLTFVPYGLLKLWYATLRLRMDAPTKAVLSEFPKNPCVIYFWHQNLFVAPMLRRLRKNRPMYGLVSASKDGAWLEALVHWFDVKSIRGSSTRRGRTALLELEQVAHENCDIIITPDGPKGPPCVIKEGSLRWVCERNFTVIVLRLEISDAWKLNSWDGFRIPKPFSTVYLTATMFDTKNFEFEGLRELVGRGM